MFKEFKTFIMRGNVVDMAIGIVMGGAFGAIVNGLVNDIVMPIIGYLLAGIDFKDMKVVLYAAEIGADNTIIKPEVAIAYGNWINTIINFLVIALCIFFVIKALNKFKKNKAEEEVEESKAADILLLEEIRDLLKK